MEKELLDEHAEEGGNRIQWANDLRRIVTRKDAVSESDGSIFQPFFKPTKIIFETSNGKKWGEKQREKLYEGLRTLGVGEWAKMKEEYAADLGEWSTLDLRGK